jgi:hypothetical protein
MLRAELLSIARFALVATLLLSFSPASARAGALTCLTGTDSTVAEDAGEIAAVQSAVDAACACASFDGTKGKKHGNYIACALDVIEAAIDAGQLRTQCKGTVKKFAAASTCGHPAAAAKAVCIQETLSSGAVKCAIKPAGSCVGKPGKYERVACAEHFRCLDAADTNGDLRIAAPGDSGDCNPVCGNGLLESGEECDGADLGGATCESLGFSGGSLACSASCEQDTSGCTEGGAFAVQVFRPSGLPVAGADVTVGAATMQTGSDGGVLFTGLPSGRTVAKVSADGFAPATAIGDVVVNATTSAQAHLLPLGDPITFDAENGVVATRGAVQVTIPPGALVDDLGDPVTGSVDMTIAVLDPSTSQVSLAPGPFIGVPEGATEPVNFESILMAEISLTQGGKAVEIAPGQSVSLVYTLPDALQGVFPDGTVIEAWYYDLDAGMWVQDGSGTIATQGGLQKWFVSVSHLTWWNCDKPWTDKNCVKVTVTRALDGSLVEGASLTAQGTSYLGTSVGITGADGMGCVDFKLNSQVALFVEHPLHGIRLGGPLPVTGDVNPSTCAGQGGACQMVDVELAGGSCVSGVVRAQDGTTPFPGASVHAVITAGVASRSFTTTSGADGSFCIPAALGADVEIVALALDGGTQLFATLSFPVGGGEAACDLGGCLNIGSLTLAELEADSCVRGRIFLQGSGGETPHADPGTPVYLYQDFPSVSCIPGEDDPHDWGTVVSEGVTDAQGYFCLPFSRFPADDGGSSSSLSSSRGASGTQTTTRYLVPGDCITRSLYGSSGGFPRTVVEETIGPDRDCDEQSCIDAGDINMFFFGGYGEA